MKKTDLSLRTHVPSSKSLTTIVKMKVIFTAFILCFTACKQERIQESNPVASDKTVAKTSSQPLPGGKTNFSLSIGRFASSGACWVRMVNWTFNASAGTIAATFWQWDSTAEKGKTIFNSHTCTFGGVTDACNTYTPTGWMIPSGQYYSMTGTYTYNTTTKALAIAWSGGTSENWTVSNPTASIARISFVSSAGSGYAITHGAGYGSNASWSTYKTIGQIPRVLYSGKHVLYNLNTTVTPSVIWQPSNATSGYWENASLDLSTSTTPSSPSPANALHFWTQGGTGCQGSTKTGNVYHLASNNNGRSMVYNHWRACLGDSQGTWPCYSGQLHPYAFQQIIDDTGAFKGFVGIEQQDQPGSTAGFQYQLIDYTLIP
jgi:hypothetical protein